MQTNDEPKVVTCGDVDGIYNSCVLRMPCINAQYPFGLSKITTCRIDGLAVCDDHPCHCLEAREKKLCEQFGGQQESRLQPIPDHPGYYKIVRDEQDEKDLESMREKVLGCDPLAMELPNALQPDKELVGLVREVVEANGGVHWDWLMRGGWLARARAKLKEMRVEV